jgi:antitoxin component of MazEF toxin-antitoxin module
MNLRVVRWGNGYGVRLPRALLSQLDAKVGDTLAVEVLPSTFVLRVVDPDGSQLAVNTAPAAGHEEAPLLDYETVERSLRSIVDQAGRLADVMAREVAAKGWVSFRAQPVAPVLAGQGVPHPASGQVVFA